MTLKDFFEQGNWTIEIKDIRFVKDSQEIVLWSSENKDKAKKQDLQIHEINKEDFLNDSLCRLRSGCYRFSQGGTTYQNRR